MTQQQPLPDPAGPPATEEQLLDLHLGRLEGRRAAEVEEAVAGSPGLALRSRALRELLDLLDRDRAPDPPDDLAERVLEHIEARGAPIRFPGAASALPAGRARDLCAGPLLSLRELITIAACITLFVGVFVPGYYKAQSVARRNVCRDNLRQIWSAMGLYAADHNGHMAYAGYVPGGSWLPSPVRIPNVPRASNTRHVFRLVRGGYIVQPQVFICPAETDARPMRAQNLRSFSDFAEPVNNSYSYSFMNLPRPPRLADMQVGPQNGMVIVADRSPLISVAGPRPIRPFDEQGINSYAHDNGAGQNAVFASGRGGWFAHPTIGVDRDDIYRAGRLLRYQGTETPTAPTDTFLIP